MEASLAATGPDAAVFVARDGRGGVAGFVSISGARRFTGEARARARGYGLVSPETGAANARARGSCAALGYSEEEVGLTEVLGDGP